MRICAHARVRDHLITTGKVLIRHIHASESRVIQKPYNHARLLARAATDVRFIRQQADKIH